MIAFVIERLEGFYDRYREKHRENRELADNAMRAVQIALRETKIYYASLERGQPRSAESELQLSRLWSAASIPLRHVDLDFAQICEQKSDYWLNPDNWNHRRVEDVNIRLQAVDRRFRSLLSVGARGLRNERVASSSVLRPTLPMTLRIIVAGTLHGLEAEIRKTTFETIHRLKNLGVPVGENMVVVGDRFDGAYVLRFVGDQTGEPDVLYVSEIVKRQFYADKDRLEIRAV